jgi:aminoglycoside phosphotransferase (APT) family kinase protein
MPDSGVVATLPDLDEAELVRRVTAQAATRDPGAAIEDLVRLEGGVSSLTFKAILRGSDGSTQPLVLKVAPPGLPPVRNRDVLRQARVLEVLAEVPGFPVPRVHLAESGNPPWFAMEFQPGDSYEPLLDVSPDPPDPTTVAERMHTITRALAWLHSKGPADLGLGDEPVVTVAEELNRWVRLFATIDEDIAAGHEKLGERLARQVPPDVSPVLVHGDYRLGNALFVGAQLQAIIDWEIWSVGDPRTDLAWVLMHTRPAHVFYEHRSPRDVAAGSLMPTPDELLATYVSARRDAGSTEDEIAQATVNLDWFLALAYYKTASTIAAIAKRERRRPRPTPEAKVLVAAARLGDILAAGHQVLDRAQR